MSTLTQTPDLAGSGPSSEVNTPPRGRLLRWIIGALPNLAVAALIAGTFILGHRTEWKLPSRSTLFGEPPAVPDWCSEHLVPESQCVECNPALLPRLKEYGWCEAHGVAECVICHPDLAQVKGSNQLPAYDTAKAIAVRPRLANNSRSTLHKARVQFVSNETVMKIGLEVDVVGTTRMQEALSAYGELTFDPTHVAHLAPRAAGSVWSVTKRIGDRVSAGEVLALVDSATVGQAKTQLLQSLVELELRRKNLSRLTQAGAAIPGRALLEAETAVQEGDFRCLAARQALVNLGFSVPSDLQGQEVTQTAEQLRLLGLPSGAKAVTQTQSANLLPVISPVDGVVVTSDVVAGEVVSPDKAMFTVADPRRLWLSLRLRAEEAQLARVGNKVQFRAAEGSQAAEGVVDWIAPTMDPQTRTVELRVVVDNSEGHLRDGTFGTGKVILRDEPQAIVVPADAIQSAGDVTLVFVRDKRYFEEGMPKVFYARQVRLGARNNKQVELLAGVLPGEVVAAKGSNVLLSQLLRSNLGAGCGCHEQQ